MSDIQPSSVPIQQEAVQFNQPVSESSASSMGGAINYLLAQLMPLGSIIQSMLEEPVFQAQQGSPAPSTWVLADGRDVTGSAYQQLTGNTNIPDLRGIFTRGLNNGGSVAGTRADGNQNPYDPTGTYTPGQYEADKAGPHNHQVQLSSVGGGPPFFAARGGANTGEVGGTTSNVADPLGAFDNLETRPKNVSVNHYIRIN